MRSLLAALAFALAIVLPLAATADGDPQLNPQVARGLKLLRMQGCTACHSLDGSISAGPSFAGRFGKPIDVRIDHQPRSVEFDAAYVRSSVESPNEAVSKGYPEGVMPRFELTEEQLAAITRALASLSTQAPTASPLETEPTGIIVLSLFVLLFVGGHLVLSSDLVRGALVKSLGEKVFQGLYALVASAGLGGMVWAYSKAPYVPLWAAPTWTRYVPLLMMPISLLFAIAGFTTKTPTQVGQAAVLASDGAAVGILRITRHPQLWGYALWSLSHIPPNGDAAAALFFGGFVGLAILGMLHIEHRRALSHGDAWKRFESVTSLIPFEAIIEGRNKLVLREIGPWRVALALALYLLLLFGHAHLVGASPWP